MAYGYSRFRKSSTRSASVYGRGLSRVPKVAYRKKTGYYTKNMKGEKKYYDKTYQCDGYETLTGTANSALNNGVTYVSSAWQTYTFGARTTAVTTSNDMFKGLATGTDARTRIGNKIRPRYIKGLLRLLLRLQTLIKLKCKVGNNLCGMQSARTKFTCEQLIECCSLKIYKLIVQTHMLVGVKLWILQIFRLVFILN